MGMGLCVTRSAERGRWCACSGERRAVQGAVVIFKSATVSLDARSGRVLSSSLNARRQCAASKIVIKSSPSLPDPPTALFSSSGVDILETPSSSLCIVRGPELLEYVESVQRLGPRLFKPALPAPNMSLQAHHVG